MNPDSPTDIDTFASRSVLEDEGVWGAEQPVSATTVERDGVRLIKATFEADDELQVRYVLSSMQSTPTRVAVGEPSLETDGADSRSVTDGGRISTESFQFEYVLDSYGRVQLSERVSADHDGFARSLPNLHVDSADTASRWPPNNFEMPSVRRPDRPAIADSGDAADATRQSSTVIVGIPAYNEGSTIGDVVEAVHPFADFVVVVDDGSDDDTAAAARGAGASLVRHQTNRGYGASLQSLFGVAERVGADSLVVIDGDGQHDPDDIPALLERRRTANADLVIGSRFTDGATTDLPLYRRVGITVINVLLNLTTTVVRGDQWLTDTQSGFRAYGRRAIASLAADDAIGDDMGASTDILHHAYRRDYVVEEVPTSVTYDVENASSQPPVTHGFTVLWSVLSWLLPESPLVLLGGPGLALVAGGIAVAWSTPGGLASSFGAPARGTLAGALVVAGLAVLFTGLRRRQSSRSE